MEQTERNELIPIEVIAGQDFWRSASKTEIEERVKEFLEAFQDKVDSGTIFVALKQLEFAVETALNQLKDDAFMSLGSKFQGLSSGSLLDHKVSICYPSEWIFSPKVETLKEAQKKELKEQMEIEKMTGIARKAQGKGRITVTLCP